MNFNGLPRTMNQRPNGNNLNRHRKGMKHRKRPPHNRDQRPRRPLRKTRTRHSRGFARNSTTRTSNGLLRRLSHHHLNRKRTMSTKRNRGRQRVGGNAAGRVNRNGKIRNRNRNNGRRHIPSNIINSTVTSLPLPLRGIDTSQLNVRRHVRHRRHLTFSIRGIRGLRLRNVSLKPPPRHLMNSLTIKLNSYPRRRKQDHHRRSLLQQGRVLRPLITRNLMGLLTVHL